jgi:glycosyltransferase involved in cell wall biosynthesis
MIEESSVRGGARVVSTSAWRVTVPASVVDTSPLLVIPTVHPRGDRRIVRCAQVALDAGFRVHFLWLGEGADASGDTAAAETLFPPPKHALERIRRVGRTSRAAASLKGDMWHVHDFYFLRQAKRWRRKSGRAVLYDVHEYYADYYAGKLPLPRAIRRLVSRILETYQTSAAAQLGAANVVTEKMAAPFRAAGVPVVVSPNYPLAAQFDGLPSRPFAERSTQVLHIGTLSEEYGTALLLELAQRSKARDLPFVFTVISRFPSPDHQRAFELAAHAAGRPDNLRLIPTRPTHEMPALLGSAGFGLSLLAVDGQNEAAVPSKNYEHVMAGLIDVVSDRKAQRAFAEEHAVAVSGHGDSADLILDRMVRLAEDHQPTDARLREKSLSARSKFTWELAVEPELAELMSHLLARAAGAGPTRNLT